MSNKLQSIAKLLKSGNDQIQPPLKWGLILVSLTAILNIGLVLSSGLVNNHQVALAQRASADGGVWRQVYQKLPDFPKENKYVGKGSRKVSENNTLVRRMVQYHLYQKGRAPNYRLDWKLTLADYLGANELMYDKEYPGHDTLKKNPLEGDRAAISRLSRSQRNALVQVLVDIFTPNSQNTKAPNSSPSN